MARDMHITRVDLPADGKERQRFRIINTNFDQLTQVIERLRLTNGLIDVSLISHGDLADLLEDDHTQYHNDARALVWLGTRSTTDLPEGTNLYWTDARFDTRFDSYETLENIASVASGDVLYHNGAAWARLAKGADGEVLTLASGVPSWQAAAAAATFLGLSDTPSSFTGHSGKYCKVNAGETGLEFSAVSGSSPLTTKGDIYGFTTVDARVPVGADGKVLTADSAEAAGVKWVGTGLPSLTTEQSLLNQLLLGGTGPKPVQADFGFRGAARTQLGVSAPGGASGTIQAVTPAYYVEDTQKRVGDQGHQVANTITTASAGFYWSPAATPNLRWHQGMAWYFDYIFSYTNYVDAVEIGFFVEPKTSVVTYANLLSAIAGTYVGSRTAAYLQGWCGITQAGPGATPLFQSADGTTVESVSLTGVNFMDGNWHEVAIWQGPDSAASWKCYVDGTIYGPLTTNVINDAGSATVFDFYPAIMCVNNGTRSASTIAWALSRTKVLASLYPTTHETAAKAAIAALA